MTEEQIQKLAEQKYPITTQTMYNEVDDIYVDIDLSEPFREAFIEGYKAAMLQNKGEWISVKETLPEFNKNVLALSKNGVIAISCVDSVGELDDFELEISNGDYYTHWQPLPAPPKQTVTQ